MTRARTTARARTGAIARARTGARAGFGRPGLELELRLELGQGLERVWVGQD